MDYSAATGCKMLDHTVFNKEQWINLIKMYEYVPSDDTAEDIYAFIVAGRHSEDAVDERLLLTYKVEYYTREGNQEAVEFFIKLCKTNAECTLIHLDNPDYVQDDLAIICQFMVDNKALIEKYHPVFLEEQKRTLIEEYYTDDPIKIDPTILRMWYREIYNSDISLEEY